MNAQQIITQLERQFRLRPSAKAKETQLFHDGTIDPTPADETTCACGGMLFTLETGKKFCLNCGER